MFARVLLVMITFLPFFSMAQDKVDAERAILEEKIKWYEGKKDTLEIIKYTVEKIERYGLDTAGFGKAALNNFIYYSIFRHSDDNATLSKACQWMELIIKSEPDNAAFLDTYANVLYKMGKRTEAIFWERKSLSLEPDNKETIKTYEQMSKGAPTWPVKLND